jgi:hypothetical protein
MNVRAPAFADMRKRCFNSIIGSQLVEINPISSVSIRPSLSGRTVSISMTDRKAFSDIPDIGAKKFPAAPFITNEGSISPRLTDVHSHTPQMTKSIFPNLSIAFCTASFSCSGLRTSPWTAMQVLPVFFESSSALAVTRSSL